MKAMRWQCESYGLKSDNNDNMAKLPQNETLTVQGSCVIRVKNCYLQVLSVNLQNKTNRKNKHNEFQ